jgi:hypothetical protein
MTDAFVARPRGTACPGATTERSPAVKASHSQAGAAAAALLCLLAAAPATCRAEPPDDLTYFVSGLETSGGLTPSPGHTCYYVDAERGDDAADGTAPDSAWRSLDRVNAQQFAPGDRILLRAGTRYAGRLRPHGSGEEGSPIAIDRYGEGEKPRIDAEGRYGEALLLHNVEYWEVANLELTNRGEQRKPHLAGARVVIRDFGTAHHIGLRNLYIHDVHGSNIKEQGASGIQWLNGGDEVPSRFDGLLIEDCHLVRTDRNGITGWSEYWSRESWYPSLNVVIRGNLLEDIGGDGIVPIGCDGALVEHNVLRGGRMRAPDYAAGIWPWSCDNTVIQFNEVSGMKGTKDGQGFDSDWNCRNTLIQYNYSHDNDGGFLLICNNGYSKPPGNVGNVGTVVRYNISRNDGARTFQISAVQNTRIYNNVIYIGEDLDVHAIQHHSWGGCAQDTHFYNNIFYVDGAARYDFADSTGNVFRNNVFFGNHIDPPDDPSAITADPLLAAPGSGGDGPASLDGYKLRAGSPCIGAGVVMPDNGRRDFWGGPVPDAAAPDIGAHQRGH